MHSGPCRCKTIDGRCRWHGTAGGTVHPLRVPESIVGSKTPKGGTKGGSKTGTASFGIGSRGLRSGGSSSSTPNLGRSQPLPQEASTGADWISGDALMAEGVLEAGDVDQREVRWNPGSSSDLKQPKPPPKARSIDPGYEATVQRFPALSKRNKRVQSTFLPWSTAYKTDDIPTHPSSQEASHIDCSNVRIKSCKDGIEGRFTDVLEPLDIDKLRKSSYKTMRDKTRVRLLLDGVGKGRADMVLSESVQLFEETLNPT
eukprot:TRINITY_DN6566_c4_g1_i1.p1 TRINITY_DN6566_c4_g1~~TRINITY_DN6566_c4_g1_i1.p1  ORF type:complete len:258 (-),score=44.07 TRINITY_DN6566_c4_g1_i1:121-894(-)